MVYVITTWKEISQETTDAAYAKFAEMFGMVDSNATVSTNDNGEIVYHQIFPNKENADKWIEYLNTLPHLISAVIENPQA